MQAYGHYLSNMISYADFAVSLKFICHGSPFLSIKVEGQECIVMCGFAQLCPAFFFMKRLEGRQCV